MAPWRPPLYPESFKHFKNPHWIWHWIALDLDYQSKQNWKFSAPIPTTAITWKIRWKLKQVAPLQAARTRYQNTIISVICPREEFRGSDCFSTASSVDKELELPPGLLSVVWSSASGIWSQKKKNRGPETGNPDHCYQVDFNWDGISHCGTKEAWAFTSSRLKFQPLIPRLYSFYIGLQARYY